MNNIRLEQFGDSYSVQTYHAQTSEWISAGYNNKTLFDKDGAESFADKLLDIHAERDKFK